MERRLTTALATDVVGCSRLMVNAGVILVTASPAFAHHDTVGGGAAIRGASIGSILPVVVGVVLFMVGVWIWGRKKRKTKSKRRKRRI